MTFSSLSSADLPGENFQYHRTSKQIIYCKPLRFGWLFNSENNVIEFSVSESDLEPELGCIIQLFISHYNIPVLKMESNRFIETISGCIKFSEHLVDLRLSQLSLDRTKLRGCDLSVLFKIQAEEISLRCKCIVS